MKHNFSMLGVGAATVALLGSALAAPQTSPRPSAKAANAMALKMKAKRDEKSRIAKDVRDRKDRHAKEAKARRDANSRAAKAKRDEKARIAKDEKARIERHAREAKARAR